MTLHSRQMAFDDVDPEYKAFVEKFKPKKTTDDCYTPPPVYEAVVAWAEERYRIAREDIVRPFYPGGDYQRFDYPSGCLVLDNPPFSIISRIIRFYLSHGVRFLLFCPALQLPGRLQSDGVTFVACSAEASIRVKAMEKEAMKCAAEWKKALRNAREIRDRLMDAIRQGAGEDHGKI